jgi:hypothetical protein
MTWCIAFPTLTVGNGIAHGRGADRLRGEKEAP